MGSTGAEGAVLSVGSVGAAVLPVVGATVGFVETVGSVCSGAGAAEGLPRQSVAMTAARISNTAPVI